MNNIPNDKPLSTLEAVTEFLARVSYKPTFKLGFTTPTPVEEHPGQYRIVLNAVYYVPPLGKEREEARDNVYSCVNNWEKFQTKDDLCWIEHYTVEKSLGKPVVFSLEDSSEAFWLGAVAELVVDIEDREMELNLTVDGMRPEDYFNQDTDKGEQDGIATDVERTV